MNFSKYLQLSIPEHVHSVRFDEKDGLPSSVTLLNYETGEFYALDKVGFDFWCLVEEKKSLEEIATVLMSTYDISKDQLWIDIEALVVSLIETGTLTLLKTSASSTPP